jgi:uncharacterized membrane protein
LTAHGEQSIMAWLPIVNPLDLTVVFVWYYLLKMKASAWGFYEPKTPTRSPSAQIVVPSIFAFLWLNTTLSRGFFHFGHIEPWALSTYWENGLWQMLIALLWATTALTLMLWSGKKALRSGWLAGALLLVGVIIKLVFVDLWNQGSLTRIFAFIGVGALILFIGYFSPLPPIVADDSVVKK